MIKEWLDNIRWKYFTNNKSSIIAKEFYHEFQEYSKIMEDDSAKAILMIKEKKLDVERKSTGVNEDYL